MSVLTETAEWLQRQGFPFDYVTEEPPPRALLRAIIDAWALADGETFEDYAWAVETETGWTLEADG